MYVKIRTGHHKPAEPKRMFILFQNVFICKPPLCRSKGEETKVRKRKKGKKEKQSPSKPLINSKTLVQYESSYWNKMSLK